MTRSSTFLPLQSSFCFRHQRYDLLSSTRYGVTNLSSNIIKHAAYAYFQLFELVPSLLFPLVLGPAPCTRHPGKCISSSFPWLDSRRLPFISQEGVN